MARLPLVRIALLGLGPDWQERLSPALEKMWSRVRVVAVYDDVALAARQAAATWQAEPVLGIRSVLMRKDVDAVVLQSTGWQRDWLLDRLRERQLPVLLGAQVDLSKQQLEAWSRVSEDEGVIVIPEFRLRYLPATLRLRELLATTLGRVRQLAIHVPGWASLLNGAQPLVQLLDWSTTLIGATPDGIEPTHIDPLKRERGKDLAEAVVVHFEKRRAIAEMSPISVELSWETTASSDDASEPGQPLCEVICERGTATILTPHELQWSAGGEPQPEKLTSDRSATEVILDLFARRVLGGLIPTPDLGDLRRAQCLAEAVQRVRSEGTPLGLRAAVDS